uniref:Putative phosphatidylinositol transfer protein pdr16 n=1 Tax=Lutzomyia longipalpis TaxID=7200 RepID=A0A1B0CKR3_LUTLO
MENLSATSEQIEELRRLFLEKVAKDGHQIDGGFHPADIERIQNREKWLRLFIEYNDLDLKKALTQLWDTCEWRKNFGTNDLEASQLRQEYLHEGFMFPKNRDINGKRLLIFRSKLYVRGTKDMDDVKRLLVYWVERVMYREEDLDQISVFFDLKDSGLSNMDMEYTRYIINLFKYYYPNSLNYIIIFEMPWILNSTLQMNATFCATFKIIKTLLPAKAVVRMKFVNGKTLHEFVDESNMLDIWGGNECYTYEFLEEETPTKSINNNVSTTGRKVHFAKLSPTESSMSDQHSPGFTMEKGTVGEEMLRVVQDTLVFNKVGTDYSGSVEIINIDLKPITYKVKTTAPDKFRVRPSSGVLAPGSTTTVNVVLVPGCQLTTLSREKFLVMCMALGADKQTNSQDIAETVEVCGVLELKMVGNVHFAKLSPTESSMSDQHSPGFTMEKGTVGEEMLRVVQDTLVFNKVGTDYSGSVEIINIDLKPITYKVKTTAPDKFRVRPSSGVLAPGSTTTVNVVLVPGCQLTTLSREKFLVMCMALGADKQTNSQDIAELWKNTPSHSHLVEQHKLKCHLPGVSHVAEVSFRNGNAFSGSSGSDSDRQLSHLVREVHDLSESVERLDARLKRNQILFFLALLAIVSFCVATLYIVKESVDNQGYCAKRDL